MFGLAGIDIAVIVVYFVVVIAIGIWASRRIKNQEDYFLAGRKCREVYSDVRRLRAGNLGGQRGGGCDHHI